MEESGREPSARQAYWVAERTELFGACNDALARVAEVLQPELVVGVGRFAEQRAYEAPGTEVRIGSVLHPSPASPAANNDWPVSSTRSPRAWPRAVAAGAGSAGRCGDRAKVDDTLDGGPALGVNLSMTKYILEHGLEPLSYAMVRYGLLARSSSA